MHDCVPSTRYLCGAIGLCGLAITMLLALCSTAAGLCMAPADSCKALVPLKNSLTHGSALPDPCMVPCLQSQTWGVSNPTGPELTGLPMTRHQEHTLLTWCQ